MKLAYALMLYSEVAIWRTYLNIHIIPIIFSDTYPLLYKTMFFCGKIHQE